MEIVLANPRGFCAGVRRAVQAVEQAIECFGPPVYVLHEIVHNRIVVASLERRGAVFVEAPEAVPPGAVCIVSAHGTAREVERRAHGRGLRVLDATCPLVARVHRQVERHERTGRVVVVIGHAGHPEVRGTCGRAMGPAPVVSTARDVADLFVDAGQPLGYVAQTTLSLDDVAPVVEALQRRFPGIAGQAPRDICYATQNRQDAVRRLAEEVQLVLVAGARHSSNALRLCETAARGGRPVHLLEHPEELRAEWLEGVERVGLTAAASAPECMVAAIVEALFEHGATALRELAGPPENVHFAPVSLGEGYAAPAARRSAPSR